MPIEGFPDTSVHRCCVRCRRWFFPNEGTDFVLPRTRLAPTEFARVVSGVNDRVHFLCDGCARRRRHIRLILFGILIATVVVIYVLKEIGVL